MSLLTQMVQEMAAGGSTGAHAIATTPGSLFGGGIVNGDRARKRINQGKKRKMMRRRLVQLTDGYVILENIGAHSNSTNFSSTDVISKLDAQEKKSNAGDDTTAFGMEDENGNLIKVYVRTDSAGDFEKALAAMLAGEDSDEDNINSTKEIAEVLFKLKDKFEIIDVVWPEITGDEEEEQEMQASDNDEGQENQDSDNDEGQENQDSEEAVDDLDNTTEPDQSTNPNQNDDGAKSALEQVIDMMKSEAEAKQAEANARKAEANAREADAVARASQSKVSQEEQIIDMEDYYKEKSTQDKEAKQLAKLAQFKHDKNKDMSNQFTAEGDQSDSGVCVSIDKLTTLILKRLGA